MFWNDLYISGTGVDLGELVTMKTAVDRGWCDPEWAERSGHLAVRIARDEQTAPGFAVGAARQALRQAGAEPGDVGPVSYAYVFHPGVTAHNPATTVHHDLGVPGGPYPIEAINSGCHGALNGLIAACHQLTCRPDGKAALVTAGEVWTAPMFDRFSPGLDMPFADGGSAALVTRSPGRFRIVATATASSPELEAIYREGAAWGPGQVHADAPFDLVTRIRSFIANHPECPPQPSRAAAMQAALKEVLTDAEITVDQIRYFVPLFTRMSVTKSQFLDGFGFSTELLAPTADHARSIGHLGAADPFAALTLLEELTTLRSGDVLLVFSGGGGWSATVVVLEVR